MRAFQSGHKQGLMTAGGFLHTLSFIMSLVCFIVISAMLGYKTIFLAPLPLAVTTLVIYLTKSTYDEQFKKWNLGPKVVHCLLASIFPIASPRPYLEVLLN